MSELDMYHTIRPSDVIRAPNDGGYDAMAEINDFVSGMSGIAVGLKQND